ncbi:metal-dependent hydrolase [Salipaludibacillus neizhouensis]|uniref:Putative metal-dependent hydrolase CR203_08890 n=1 Tax=Salipaludibacillus neizhouensis TaxID=885475 RepID=A0A3A9KA89_9BACI|nr:bacillithiol transferase BstA [Salipaludibacillus neizhouensis]RKL67462.1 metal-dependent hydrolase [Salipaludibacillus neizhouensis]
MDLRYPIGEFEFRDDVTMEVVQTWISEIDMVPVKLREAVDGLNDQQLDTPYRQGGWTIRQVVHHMADSHINAYMRVKLALTENKPTIMPYEEAKWAELPDSEMPIDVSLTLLFALHQRWVTLLQSLEPSDLEKTFYHPESGEMKLGINIGNYSWHGRHHISHITTLRERNGWY